MISKLDAADRHILDELQRDAGRSHQDIAAAAHLSATSCWRRIKALEETGVITGRVALLNGDRLGLHVHVLCNVYLKEHSAAARASVERLVAERPEIVEAYTMTGDTDYLFRVVVPDVAAYEHFLITHLLDHGRIASVNSSFALRQIKYTTALPLDLAAGAD